MTPVPQNTTDRENCLEMMYLESLDKKIDSLETKVDALTTTVSKIVQDSMVADHKQDLAIHGLELKIGLIGAGAGLFVPILFEILKWFISH